MSKKIKIDMTGVESYQKASEGEHTAKIVTVKETQTQGGNDAIQIGFEVIKGDDKGSRVYETFPLVDTALWKLKGMLNAIGMKADGKVVLDIDKLVGKVCLIEVFWDEYNGQQRAKISEFRKFVSKAEDEDSEDDEDDDDEDEDEDEEEKPAKKSKKSTTKSSKSKKKPAPKDEDEDEDEDEEDEDDDDDEEDEPPKKSKKSKSTNKPAAKSKKSKAKDEDEDEDDDDDDDDWEEEDE